MDDNDFSWEQWEAYENSITNLTNKLGKIEQPDLDHLQLAMPHLSTEDAKQIISCYRQNQFRRDSIKRIYPSHDQILKLISDNGQSKDSLTTPEKRLFQESRSSIIAESQGLYHHPNQQQQQINHPRLLKERDSLDNLKDIRGQEERPQSEAERLLKESEKKDDLAGSECNVTIGDGRVCGRYHYKTEKKCWILKNHFDDYIVSLIHDGTWKLIDSDGETLYHNQNHGKFPPPSEWIQTNEEDDLPIPAPSLKIFFAQNHIPKRKPIKRGKNNTKNGQKRQVTHKMNPKYELSEEEHMKRVMEQQKELKGQNCYLCEEGCIIS